MTYDSATLPIEALLLPVAEASAALARFDERLSRSPLRDGCVNRLDFADACASQWIDGELVHVEDLVFHDAGLGLRTPTHELTIAADILRTRRRIMGQRPDWAMSADGLRSLRGRGARHEPDAAALETKAALALVQDAEADELDTQIAAIDAVLARSKALLADAASHASRAEGSSSERAAHRERDALVYEEDWDEDGRLDEWKAVLRETHDLPAVLRAALVLDAWNSLQVLQHAPWLGRLLTAALLRQAGLAGRHLPGISFGLKLVPREERTSRNRTTRLVALLESIRAGAEAGLKEHDRLLLAQPQMQRRLVGRRSNSRLPQLVDLVLSRPMVSAGMIAEVLRVTPQGALKIAAELNLRELTGRGRFRAWGII